MNLDTNILIAFFAEEAEVVDFVKTAREKKIILFISAIVEAELFSFTALNDTDMENMRNFIDENLVVIPIDRYTLKFAS